MPKRTDIKSVMVIGSGPIVIGQAAEFDYSGTQACRVLREEGIRVILVNSNPATIMTDPEMADATYIEPISTPILEQIIAKERPDALLPTLGGQTALNAAMALGEAGVLKKYNVELIGASLDAIDRGEDRELFKKVVEEAGAESARSDIAHSLEEVDKIAEKFGYPLVVRPSFTMGGLGSGIAHDEDELHRIAGAGIHYSPTDEVLIEEGIEGWKEYELELMRDKKDKSEVVVHENGRDSVSEAFRIVRTNMDFMRVKDKKMQVVMFTSFNPGAGKTFVSMNLAMSFALTHKKVVLVDLDIRKGTLSSHVRVSDKGVTNYLSGRIDNVDEIIRQNELCDKLDIIHAGPVPPNPAELLLGDRLETLIAELRKRYDYIILDNVPAGVVADAVIVNRVADLTIYVVRAGRMDRRALPEVEKLYQEGKLRNMSLILNGTVYKHGAYGYRYGYGYGYSYGYGYGYGQRKNK